VQRGGAGTEGSEAEARVGRAEDRHHAAATCLGHVQQARVVRERDGAAGRDPRKLGGIGPGHDLPPVLRDVPGDLLEKGALTFRSEEEDGTSSVGESAGHRGEAVRRPALRGPSPARSEEHRSVARRRRQVEAREPSVPPESQLPHRGERPIDGRRDRHPVAPPGPQPDEGVAPQRLLARPEAARGADTPEEPPAASRDREVDHQAPGARPDLRRELPPRSRPEVQRVHRGHAPQYAPVGLPSEEREVSAGEALSNRRDDRQRQHDVSERREPADQDGPGIVHVPVFPGASGTANCRSQSRA
jgi:hypothetical protein